MWGFVMTCPGCGYVWETQAQVIVDELAEVHSEEVLRQAELRQQAEFFRQQRQKAYREGAAPNWAKHVFQQEYGCPPDSQWCIGSIFGINPTPQDMIAYRNYLTAIARRQGKPITWVIEEFQQEFGDQSEPELLWRNE